MEQGAADQSNPRSSRLSLTLATLAISAGVVLRAIEFMRDRPLWLDEAMLALNIAGRTIGQLARPLDYDQSAPLLYLWAERLAVSVGGVNECALRALPFIAGLALLPALWFVARRLAGPVTAAIVTVLASLSVALVSFSAEAKQYGVDPAATLLATWLASAVARAPSDRRAWMRLWVGGIVCLLLSQPAAFVLGGIVAALAADSYVRRAERAWRRLAFSCLAWGAVFAALYVAVYRSTARSAYMQRFWEGTFLDPRATDFASRLRMFATAAFAAPTLDGQAASSVVALAILALAWLGGVWILWRHDRFSATLAGMPLCLAAIASAARSYPVMDRLFLFAAPLTLLAFAALLARATELVPLRGRTFAFGGVCTGIAVLVAPSLARHVTNPVVFGVGRQVVVDVDSMSRGEPVYVAARSFPLWIFYTTDWHAPDRDRLRWAASIAGAGGPAHNNAPSRGVVRAEEGKSLTRASRGRTEIVGIPTGRQYVTSSRTMDASLSPAEYALPLQPDTGWAQYEVERMAVAATPRLWLFGSHMFALDGAEPGLVAELQRRGVRLIMERRQGTTVGYHVEFPASQ